MGAVVLVLSLGAQVNHQLSELAGHLAWLVNTHRAVGRLVWLMDHADQARAALEPRDPAPVPARLQQGIMLEGVRFRYPGTETDVLNQVDLLLPAGKTVAVVGDNGGGKTTLIKLLCRFYEPTAGRITVDGVDLRTVLDGGLAPAGVGRLPGLRPAAVAGARVDRRRRGGAGRTRTAPCMSAMDRAAAADLHAGPAARPGHASWAASSRTASSCRSASGRRRRSAGR